MSEEKINNEFEDIDLEFEDVTTSIETLNTRVDELISLMAQMMARLLEHEEREERSARIIPKIESVLAKHGEILNRVTQRAVLDTLWTSPYKGSYEE